MKKFVITVNGQPYDVEVEEVKTVKSSKPSSAQSVSASPATAKTVSAPAPSTSGSSKINSPMPGSILKVNVAKGDTIKKGQSLLILEAMKMENEIKAKGPATIAQVHVSVGDTVVVTRPSPAA